MTETTDFSRFRHAVERLLEESIAHQVRVELETGSMDANPEDTIGTDDGLFSVESRGNQLCVARIILHIADFTFYLPPDAETKYLAGKHNAHAVVYAAHRYHFFKCQTVVDKFRQNQKDRFKKSQKDTGRFSYNFIRGNKAESHEDQKLYPCTHCLKEFSRRYGKRYWRETFSPKVFFDQTPSSEWLEDRGYSPDAAPNLYPPGFKQLSARVRELRDYTCQACGRRLEAEEDRKFLHCHHLHGDKTDNNPERLEVLCIECHAEEPGHQRLRKTPQYREFMEKFHGGNKQEETLPPKVFSEQSPSSEWLEDRGYSPGATPDLYPPGFEQISARVRELRDYTCQACGRRLEAEEDRKFLHCHHLHGDKTDSVPERLQVLCIECHAEQPGHQHLRETPQYREFMEKFHGDTTE